MQQLHRTKQRLELKEKMEHYLQEELEEVEQMKKASQEVVNRSEDAELRKQVRYLYY